MEKRWLSSIGASASRRGSDQRRHRDDSFTDTGGKRQAQGAAGGRRGGPNGSWPSNHGTVSPNRIRGTSIASAWISATLTPYQLVRQFHDTFGLPPHRFVLDARIQKAKRLIQEDTPLATVALRTGFCDQSHLTRHFRRVVGLPPGR